MLSFYSIHFGCRANQADAAAIEADLAQRGFRPAGDLARAQVVVLNSCTVTAAADAELRQTVRRIHRENPAARILVTGCYAQRCPDEIAALPGVEWIVGNSHKHAIGDLVSSRQATDGSSAFVPLQDLFAVPPSRDVDYRMLGSVASADDPQSSSWPQVLVGHISAERHFPSAPFFGGAIDDRTRPNLKIQDGCDNRCSFCIIPSVRGLSRSLPAQEVLRQIRALAESGYREVVLSGVNLGQYGRDLPGQPRFVRLIRMILDETPVERLRISSVEPMDWTDSLLDLTASTPRIARHVHAPLQSGSDRILRLMHRKYRVAQYCDRIVSAFGRMPDAAFGADVIVGFPGETDDDFEQTRSLIESLPFTYLHVFPFSRRPGTPADRVKDQVHGSVARERSRVLRELGAEKNRRFGEQQLGRTLAVLTLEESAVEGTVALAGNYLKVFIPGNRIPANQWVQARVVSVRESSLIGTLERFGAESYRPELAPSITTCASA